MWPQPRARRPEHGRAGGSRLRQRRAARARCGAARKPSGSPAVHFWVLQAPRRRRRPGVQPRGPGALGPASEPRPAPRLSAAQPARPRGSGEWAAPGAGDGEGRGPAGRGRAARWGPPLGPGASSRSLRRRRRQAKLRGAPCPRRAAPEAEPQRNSAPPSARPSRAGRAPAPGPRTAPSPARGLPGPGRPRPLSRPDSTPGWRWPGDPGLASQAVPGAGGCPSLGNRRLVRPPRLTPTPGDKRPCSKSRLRLMLFIFEEQGHGAGGRVVQKFAQPRTPLPSPRPEPQWWGDLGLTAVLKVYQRWHRLSPSSRPQSHLRDSSSRLTLPSQSVTKSS